jgi:hypothetical protein
MVKILQEPLNKRSCLPPIIREAKEAGDELPGLVVKHLRREHNCVTHELAQLAKRTAHAVVWRGRSPVCVEQLVAQDCNEHSE